jgi:hypothetical protein
MYFVILILIASATVAEGFTFQAQKIAKVVVRVTIKVF